MANYIFDTGYAKTLLLSGKIVAIPTETVYGLAANAHDMKAIQKIYDLKKRPLDKALALNIHPSWDIKTWCSEIPEYVYQLVKLFWPGPLTIICSANLDHVPSNILGPNNTIALRCPNHPLTLDLLDKLGTPLVAPSANPSDQLSPTTALQVMNYFKDDEVFILEGGRCPLGLESTILQAISATEYDLLRLGAISLDTIENSIGFAPRHIPESYFSAKLAIPMYYFKKPSEILEFVNKHAVKKFLCLASENTLKNHAFEHQKALPHDRKEYQQSFYQILLDAQNGPYEYIFIEYPLTSKTLQARIHKYAKPIQDA